MSGMALLQPKIPHFYTQTRSSKWIKSRINQTVVKENGAIGGRGTATGSHHGRGDNHGQPLVVAVPPTLCRGSHHGQPMVVAVPPTLLFSLGGFVLTCPSPWYLLWCIRVGSFRAFLTIFFDPVGLKIIFYSYNLGL